MTELDQPDSFLQDTEFLLQQLIKNTLDAVDDSLKEPNIEPIYKLNTTRENLRMANGLRSFNFIPPPRIDNGIFSNSFFQNFKLPIPRVVIRRVHYVDNDFDTELNKTFNKLELKDKSKLDFGKTTKKGYMLHFTKRFGAVMILLFFIFVTFGVLKKLLSRYRQKGCSEVCISVKPKQRTFFESVERNIRNVFRIPDWWRHSVYDPL